MIFIHLKLLKQQYTCFLYFRVCHSLHAEEMFRYDPGTGNHLSLPKITVFFYLNCQTEHHGWDCLKTEMYFLAVLKTVTTKLKMAAT